MKKILFIALFVLCLLAVNVAALSFSPSGTLTMTSSDPGSTVTDSTSVDITSAETTQHIIRFTNGVLSQGSRSINLALPADITLASLAQADVTFQVVVPANQYAGTYSGNLVATSTTSSSVTATKQVSLSVNPKPSATVTSVSFSAGRGLSKTVNNAFTITNNGNTDLSSIQVSVSALSDGTNTLSATLSPTNTNINYGASAVNVAVSINNIPAAQPTGVYTGTITVSYGGTTSATSTLTVTVRDPVHKVEVSGNEIVAGSSTQARNQTITKTFTVQNTGDYPETVALTLEGVSTKYAAQLLTSSISLSSGQSQNVQLTLTVPKDQDTGIQNLGSVKMTYNTQQITSVPLKLETQNMLSIETIKTQVGGDDSDSNLGDGQTLNDPAKPGEEIEFDISVKTLYTSSDNVNLENVVVSVEPIDDDLFDSDESEEFDLSAGSSARSKTVKISVPEKINEGTYDVDLIVEGEDENGAKHSVTYTVSFEVAKDDHDVKISEATLGTSTLKCARNTQLRVTITNFGAKDQKKAALAIYNQDLNLNENIMNIFLSYDYEDSDNDFTKTVSLDLPDDFEAGTYPITIKVFRDDDKEMDSQFINLKVEDCPALVPVEPVDNTTVIITPTAPTTPSGSDGVVETVEGTSFTSSSTFIFLLIGLNVVMLLAIIGLVVKFLI